MQKIDRIKEIVYQILKLPGGEYVRLTDEQLVAAVRSIYDEIIDVDNYLTDFSGVPSLMMGVTISWAPDGKSITLIRDSINMVDDLSDTVVPVVPYAGEGFLMTDTGDYILLDDGSNLNLIWQ